MILKSTCGRGELEGILSARASSCCEISNSWDNLRSGHRFIRALTFYWKHFWVIDFTPFRYLGSDRMDFLVNSEYLASDSSRPLLRPPFDFFLWPFFASWSSLPFWLFEACFVGLWPIPFGIWTFVIDIWPFAVDIWPFEVDIWPLAVKPIFGVWSLEIPVIFKLVALFALQGDDGCSMRLLILQITIFFCSSNQEMLNRWITVCIAQITSLITITWSRNARMQRFTFHFSFLHHEIFIQLDVTSKVNYYCDSLHVNNHISQERKDVSCDRCCSGRSERNPRYGDKKSWILRHEKSTLLLSLSLNWPPVLWKKSV